MAIPVVTDLLSSAFTAQEWVQTDKINTDENGVPLGDLAEAVGVTKPTAEVGNGFCAALQQLSNFVRGVQSITALSVASSLGIPVYTTAGRPAAGTAGRVIFDSDLGTMLVDNGTDWVSVGGGASPTILIDTLLTGWTPTDLNVTPGDTVTDPAGAQWTTQTVAADGQDMILAATSFGITANGLEVVGATNTRIDAVNRTCQLIYINLRDLAIAYGIDMDPRSNLAFQVHIASQNEAADHEYSGVAIWRPGNAVTSSPTLFGDAALYAAGVGRVNGNNDSGMGHGGTSVGPTKFSRPGIPTVPDVACIVHNGSRDHNPMIGAYETGEFPPGHSLRATVGVGDSTPEENDIVMDPWQGFRVGIFHCAENNNNTYNSAIDRFQALKL